MNLLDKESKKASIFPFVILLIAIFLLSFTIGRYTIDIVTLLRVFLSKIFPLEKNWADTIETVVFQVRLPRIMAAVLVGLSLSLSGVVYQGMFKNPLVSPDILGVSAGSAFGAALAIYFSLSTTGIQLSAFIFGTVAVALVYFISQKIKADPIMALVIIGILIGSLFNSFVSLIKYLADTEDKLPAITFWLMGSLSGVMAKDVKAISIPILLGIVPLFILRWRLNVLTLSEEEAKCLGLDTGSSTFQYRVKDIVLMGRTAYLKFSSSPSKEDGKIAEEAMETLKISHLKDKIYSQLSGGERQLVKIAQALAQQSKIIIMDEPTNNLDFGNQMVMLKHLKECSEKGMTIIMVTHFPEHAFLYGTRALLVKDGKVTEVDNPNENLKEGDLKDLYGVDLKVSELKFKNKTIKMCIPMI